MRAVFIHGLNTRDGGRNSLDKMALPFLAWGWDVDTDEGDPGFLFLQGISFIGRRLSHKRILQKIIPAVARADLIVTHSYGAELANLALQRMGPKHFATKMVAHISPALDRDSEPAEAVRRQLVIHTRNDFAVKFAARLPWSPLGSMGAFGYSGSSDMVDHLDYTEKSAGHSAYFRAPVLIYETASAIRDWDAAHPVPSASI